MPWGYAIAAAGTIAAGYLQGDASKDAAKDANKGQQEGIDWLKQVYGDSQGNFNPYIDYGKGSLGGLSKLMGGDYSGFMNSPDFKARVGFANDQFNNGAAAHYRLFSGGAQNDRDELNQNLAAQGLNDYRNFLMNGAQMGQNASAQLGSIGTGTGAQIAQGYGNMGLQSAYGTIGQGNANTNTLNGLASIFGDYVKTRSSNSSYGGGSQNLSGGF
jgi:hypothetical protein